jgi:DNA-binding transcriptional MerR regulator
MAPSLLLNVDMKSIGQIAAQFGLATHVLRHWESMGLLTPPRTVAGRRRYGDEHRYRIALILNAKDAGFGLDDIRELVNATGPAERTAVLRRQRADLARRLTQVQTSLHLIDCALACDHADFTECPNFQALLANRITARPRPAIRQ